jgi:hypothetical protein
MAGDEAAEEETNFYKLTLKQCRDSLLPSATHAVYAGQGDPGSSIASAINGGGWDCTEGTKWATELLEHTRKVMPAFDDAAADVTAAINAQPEKVPKGDPHGIAWNRIWHMQRYNL